MEFLPYFLFISERTLVKSLILATQLVTLGRACFLFLPFGFSLEVIDIDGAEERGIFSPPTGRTKGGCVVLALEGVELEGEKTEH